MEATGLYTVGLAMATSIRSGTATTRCSCIITSRECLEVAMWPAAAPVLPLRFADPMLEAEYAAELLPHIRWRTLGLSTMSLLIAAFAGTDGELDPGRSTAEAFNLTIRFIYLMAMVGLLALHRCFGELMPTLICLLALALVPPMHLYRSGWAVGDIPSDVHGEQLHMPGDETLLLSMVGMVASLLLVIPMRSRIAWCLPAGSAIVYLIWTLALPFDGPVAGVANRLTAIFAHGIVCMLLLCGHVQREVLDRHRFMATRRAQNCLKNEAALRIPEIPKTCVDSGFGHIDKQCHPALNKVTDDEVDNLDPNHSLEAATTHWDCSSLPSLTTWASPTSRRSGTSPRFPTYPTTPTSPKAFLAFPRPVVAQEESIDDDASSLLSYSSEGCSVAAQELRLAAACYVSRLNCAALERAAGRHIRQQHLQARSLIEDERAKAVRCVRNVVSTMEAARHPASSHRPLPPDVGALPATLYHPVNLEAFEESQGCFASECSAGASSSSFCLSTPPIAEARSWHAEANLDCAASAHPLGTVDASSEQQRQLQQQAPAALAQKPARSSATRQQRPGSARRVRPAMEWEDVQVWQRRVHAEHGTETSSEKAFSSAEQLNDDSSKRQPRREERQSSEDAHEQDLVEAGHTELPEHKRVRCDSLCSGRKANGPESNVGDDDPTEHQIPVSRCAPQIADLDGQLPYSGNDEGSFEFTYMSCGESMPVAWRLPANYSQRVLAVTTLNVNGELQSSERLIAPRATSLEVESHESPGLDEFQTQGRKTLREDTANQGDHEAEGQEFEDENREHWQTPCQGVHCTEELECAVSCLSAASLSEEQVEGCPEPWPIPFPDQERSITLPHPPQVKERPHSAGSTAASSKSESHRPRNSAFSMPCGWLQHPQHPKERKRSHTVVEPFDLPSPRQRKRLDDSKNRCRSEGPADGCKLLADIDTGLSSFANSPPLTRHRPTGRPPSPDAARLRSYTQLILKGKSSVDK